MVSRPKKPEMPIKPLETYLRRQTIDIKYGFSLKGICDKVPAGVNFDEVIFYNNGYQYDIFGSLMFYIPEPNLNYLSEMEIYNNKNEKYLKDLKDYEVKYKKFNKQNKMDKIKKLEEELQKLKGA